MCPASPKRPRRKAKQARAHETVDAILEAAARVLARDGYSAATTNRIARAAGVSVGTIYEYFARKEEIFEALIERELSAIVGAIRAAGFRPEAAVDEKLVAVTASAMAAMRYGPELFRSLDQVPGATFRRRLADARRAVIGFVRQILEDSRSDLIVPDLDLAAFVVVSAVEGIGGNASSEDFDARLIAEIRSLLRAYLMGEVEGRTPAARQRG
jgi:AcrR family transcriptional regulator